MYNVNVYTEFIGADAAKKHACERKSSMGSRMLLANSLSLISKAIKPAYFTFPDSIHFMYTRVS